MKLMNKMAVALIALSCIANVSAYTWGFTNHTDETIDIHFGLKLVPGWFDGTVKPGERITFDWPFGNARAGHLMYNSFEWKRQGESYYKLKSVPQRRGQGECYTGCEFEIKKGNQGEIFFVDPYGQKF